MRHRWEKIIWLRDFKDAMERASWLMDENADDIVWEKDYLAWVNPDEGRRYAVTRLPDGKCRIDSMPAYLNYRQDAELTCMGI